MADPADLDAPPDGPEAPVPRFRAPDTTLILSGIIVLVAALTWVVLPGESALVEIEVEGVGTHEVAFGLGIAALVTGVLTNETARAFTVGVQDPDLVALITGLAKGVLVVLQDGQVVDTILYALASGLDGAGPGMAASAMFAGHATINAFVLPRRGSGRAYDAADSAARRLDRCDPANGGARVLDR